MAAAPPLAIAESISQTETGANACAAESLKLPERHPATANARFAASLITCRLGIAGYDLPLPGEKELLRAEGTPAQRIELRKMEPAGAKLVVEAMRRFPYGNVEFDLDAVTGVHCAGETNVILINREFSKPGTLVKATQRKALFGIGALQSPETGDFSPSYLLFTHPSATTGTVHMIVTRCSGAYAMFGLGRLEGKTTALTRSVPFGVPARAPSFSTREPPRTVRNVVVERA